MTDNADIPTDAEMISQTERDAREQAINKELNELDPGCLTHDGTIHQKRRFNRIEQQQWDALTKERSRIFIKTREFEKRWTPGLVGSRR